jgi:hypothetical protein
MTMLETYLDTEIAAIVTKARALYPMDPQTFNGTVSGLLLASGVQLAVVSGVPKPLLKEAVLKMFV